MTSLMITESIEIDAQKKTVILPKFSLYDFNSKPGCAASSLEVLRCLACYITKKEHRMAASKLLSDAPNITIRFKQISFRCRLLRLYESNSASTSASGDTLDTAAGASPIKAAGGSSSKGYDPEDSEE